MSFAEIADGRFNPSSRGLLIVCVGVLGWRRRCGPRNVFLVDAAHLLLSCVDLVAVSFAEITHSSPDAPRA